MSDSLEDFHNQTAQRGAPETNRSFLSRFNIPPSRNKARGGQYADLAQKRCQIPIKSQDGRPGAYQFLAKPDNSQLYGQIVGRWLHRYSEAHGNSVTKTLIDTISHFFRGNLPYTEQADGTGEIVLSLKEHDPRAGERTALITPKANGVHIMLILKVVRMEAADKLQCEIEEIRGKKGNFDGMHCRNDAFGDVVSGLLHNARFELPTTCVDQGEKYLLLQGELITTAVDSTHVDTCKLVQRFGKPETTLGEKYNILTKLRLLFFNAGGFTKRQGCEPEKFKPYSHIEVDKILSALHNQTYKPHFASGNPVELLSIPRLLIREPLPEKIEHDIMRFCKNVEGYGEGHIARFFNNGEEKYMKIKRVYCKNKAYCFKLMKTPNGRILVVAIMPTGQTEGLPIGVVVTATEDSDPERPTYTHREIAGARFHFEPVGIELGPAEKDIYRDVYYKQNTEWDAADYFREICKDAKCVPHSVDTKTDYRGRHLYTVDGATFFLRNYHFDTISFLDITALCENSDMHPYLSFKANEILLKDGRAPHQKPIPTVDTAVFTGVTVPKSPVGLSITEHDKCADVLFPDCDDKPYKALSKSEKMFFRQKVAGKGREDGKMGQSPEDLPSDIGMQAKFMDDLYVTYDDLHESWIVPVPEAYVTPLYKLLARYYKPRSKYLEHCTAADMGAARGPVEAATGAARGPVEAAMGAACEPVARQVPETAVLTLRLDSFLGSSEASSSNDSCRPLKRRYIHQVCKNDIKALGIAGRHFGIHDLSADQLIDLFDNCTPTEKKSIKSWKECMDSLTNPSGMVPAAKSQLTSAVKHLITLLTPRQGRDILGIDSESSVSVQHRDSIPNEGGQAPTSYDTESDDSQSMDSPIATQPLSANPSPAAKKLQAECEQGEGSAKRFRAECEQDEDGWISTHRGHATSSNVIAMQIGTPPKQPYAKPMLYKHKRLQQAASSDSGDESALDDELPAPVEMSHDLPVPMEISRDLPVPMEISRDLPAPTRQAHFVSAREKFRRLLDTESATAGQPAKQEEEESPDVMIVPAPPPPAPTDVIDLTEDS